MLHVGWLFVIMKIKLYDTLCHAWQYTLADENAILTS